MSKINTLADRYAAAKAVLDEQAAIVAELKDAIKALGVEQIEGNSCFVNVGLSERSTLDGKAVETELGKAWVKAHSKVTLVERVTIKAKPQKNLVAAAVKQLSA